MGKRERENEWCCIFQLNVCSGSSGWRRDDAVDDDEDEENIFLVLQNSREENKIERERERGDLKDSLDRWIIYESIKKAYIRMRIIGVVCVYFLIRKKG